MRTLNRIIGRLAAGITLSVNLAALCNAQQLQFTDVRVLPDEGIQLYWQSESNTVYRVEYASELVDSGTAWSVLYDDYPSHGTNTFWMDTGDYNQEPAIPYFAKAPMRFYRLFNKGTNSASPPYVAITSITNGASLSGDIIVSVVATSSFPIVTHSLFVDGQEMDSSDDGTNYLINTCEWPNGPHVLFATARTQSALSGPSGSFPIDLGRNVSAYKSVTFDNLIHKVGFSEPFFEPSLGQTQQVSAAFSANVDWTLQIIDESSNVVRTATGSGTTFHFDWDGTDGSGANIADGVYYYLITAETNGQAFSNMTGGGDSFPSSSALFPESEPMQLWVLQPSGSSVPLNIYPYGIDTNGFTIFEASRSEVFALNKAILALNRSTIKAQPSITMDSGGGVAAAYASPSQSTIAPKKPPTKPVKNQVGSVGVAFFNHSTTNVYGVPKNGLPLTGNSGKVQIEGSFNNIQFDPIPEAPTAAKKFVTKMGKNGWKLGFNKSGTNLTVTALKQSSLGGSDLFGSVNLGLFIDHGNYGTGIDYHSFASQSKQSYFSSDNPADASNPWIAFSEFGFGGGNLRWIAILACNSVENSVYQSMLNKGVLPLQSGNHIICGMTTVGAIGEDIGEIWAKKMLGGGFSSAQKVKDAWFSAGRGQYQYATNLTGTITFRAFGWEDCIDDKLSSYSPTTSGDIVYEDSQVYP